MRIIYRSLNLQSISDYPRIQQQSFNLCPIKSSNRFRFKVFKCSSVILSFLERCTSSNRLGQIPKSEIQTTTCRHKREHPILYRDIRHNRLCSNQPKDNGKYHFYFLFSLISSRSLRQTLTIRTRILSRRYYSIRTEQVIYLRELNRISLRQ